jgi:predicted homoserine dehydrogenase-like protein
LPVAALSGGDRPYPASLRRQSVATFLFQGDSMSASRPLRLGIMGFGQTGRQIYDLAANADDIEVIAIADVGRRTSCTTCCSPRSAHPERYRLEGNFLTAAASARA